MSDQTNNAQCAPTLPWARPREQVCPRHTLTTWKAGGQTTKDPAHTPYLYWDKPPKSQFLGHGHPDPGTSLSDIHLGTAHIPSLPISPLRHAGSLSSFLLCLDAGTPITSPGLLRSPSHKAAQRHLCARVAAKHTSQPPCPTGRGSKHFGFISANHQPTPTRTIGVNGSWLWEQRRKLSQSSSGKARVRGA